MNCFAVILSQPNENSMSKITKVFPDYYQASDSIWFVYGNYGTSADVCTALGINKDGESGIVLKVTDYYGLYDGALWAKIADWQGRNK